MLAKSTNVFQQMSENKILNLIERARQAGQRIIATNGCFDILHIGHLRYLEKSKKLGDLLVVGINSDLSVKALKGPSRPINNQADRAELLLGLKPVDFVIIFEETDACNFLKKVKPDVYTKGGDYSPDELKNWPEYKTAQLLGCKIEIISLIEGKSSTQTINKINDASL
jgi:rfaE bifunctional protein nucleotidyltransferase chain/domain